LIRLLHNLRDIGNTVLVVEHDADMMRAADHILDIGPAAVRTRRALDVRRRLSGIDQEFAIVDRAPISAASLRSESLSIAGLYSSSVCKSAAPPSTILKNNQCRYPARHAGLRHGRQRLGKIDADSRFASMPV